MAAILLLAAMQLVRPSHSNPAVDPQLEIGAVRPVVPEVAAVLGRSCTDCHSNRTVWPWYSHVAPVSWLVARDVAEGRREMNLSAWGAIPASKQQELLKRICKEVSEGDMPLFAYRLAHPAARLGERDVQAVCTWTSTLAQQPARPTALNAVP
jgi:hypothetical protein